MFCNYDFIHVLKTFSITPAHEAIGLCYLLLLGAESSNCYAHLDLIRIMTMFLYFVFFLYQQGVSFNTKLNPYSHSSQVFSESLMVLTGTMLQQSYCYQYNTKHLRTEILLHTAQKRFFIYFILVFLH